MANEIRIGSDSTGLLLNENLVADNTGTLLPVVYNITTGEIKTDNTISIYTIQDDILDWSTNKYTPYTTKAAGKLYITDTTVPTNTNRLNYDGYFYSTRLYAAGGTTSYGIYGAATSGYGIYGLVTTGIGLYSVTTTGIAGVFNVGSASTAHIINFQKNSNTVAYIDYTGDINSLVLKTNGTTSTAGYFDNGVTQPTHTNRLNYDGNLYTSALYLQGTGIFNPALTQNCYVFDTNTLLTGITTVFDFKNHGTSILAFNLAYGLHINDTYFLPLTDGTTGQYLKTDGSGTLSWGTLTTVPTARTAGNSGIGYVNYACTTKTDGQFYGGTPLPNNATRLNYDGNLHANVFFATTGVEIWTGNLTIDTGHIEVYNFRIYGASMESDIHNLDSGVRVLFVDANTTKLAYRDASDVIHQLY